MATSFSGGGSRSTRREPPTMGNQLVNVELKYIYDKDILKQFILHKIEFESARFYCIIFSYIMGERMRKNLNYLRHWHSLIWWQGTITLVEI